MKLAKPLFSVVALASLTLAACIAPGEVEENIDSADQAVLLDNALLDNALLDNALLDNALLDNALLDNALLDNALLDNALLDNALEDPNAREVLKYIVSCALKPSQHVDFTVDGVDYSFDGNLGLAPEWGKPGGKCGPTCQEWVSACVLARVDYLGEKKLISLRGLHPALKAPPAEQAAYTEIEATYYGNIFTSPMKLHACLPPGATQIPRVCGPSIEGCVAGVVGECEDLCVSMPDGTYANCRDRERVGKHFPSRTEIYKGSITVFLEP
jgi:hypothetical protein